MNIKIPVLAGLMCLPSFAPCKAQNTGKLLSSTGITKSVTNKFSYFNGLEYQFLKGKNFTDIFTGGMIQPDRNISFLHE